MNPHFILEFPPQEYWEPAFFCLTLYFTCTNQPISLPPSLPSSRFIYWTETSSNTDITRLFQLNLRIPGSTSSTSLSAASRRRRKRRRRQTDLTAVSLSSALAQDSLTGNLYVSDINTGNILSCAPSEGLSCNVIVDRTTLVVPNGVQDIGLLPHTPL